MKNLGISLLALCVIAGCAQSPPKPIDTSGSHPAFGKTAPMTAEAKEAEVDTGRLLVHAPTGYTVYTEDGYTVAREEGPVERTLAPGRYFVRLNEKLPGRDFWVTVERGKVTRVENPAWGGAPPTVR